MSNEEKALECLKPQAKLYLSIIIEWLIGKGLSRDDAEKLVFDLIAEIIGIDEK